VRPRALTKLAWRGLTQHKLRSILSALGIVFGVGAVIAMLSVGEGARREILAEVGRLGITRVSVRAGAISEESERDARTLQSPGLTLADANAITEVCPTVESLAPLRESSEQILRGQRRAEATLVATTPSFVRTEELLLSGGRFLTDTDVREAKRVIVLGHDLAESLFPYETAVGLRVKIGADWYAVVGSLEAREVTRRGSQISGRNLNRVAFVPLSVMPAPAGRVDEIAIRIVDADAVLDSARLIETVVARRHRGARDFELVVPQELIAGYERARFQFNVVVGAVAAISLVVGGIGIMNIMLANVTERIREIGVRRSLGASRRDIVHQFLMEALLLTGAGGVVGIVLGALASFAVSSYADWPTALSARAVGAAIGLALATGVGFGLYPAIQAAHKNPVEALRHE
jgi:putative ABC transport system permease protein